MALLSPTPPTRSLPPTPPGAAGPPPEGPVPAPAPAPDPAPPADPPLPADQALRRMEVAVAWVLRAGVVLSVALVLAGLGLVLAQHPSYARLTGGPSYHAVAGPGISFPHSPAGALHALAAGDGTGLIVLGLFVLILTPVLRVVVGVVGFALQRDAPMTLVTLAVLAVLVASFMLGGL